MTSHTWLHSFHPQTTQPIQYVSALEYFALLTVGAEVVFRGQTTRRMDPDREEKTDGGSTDRLLSFPVGSPPPTLRPLHNWLVIEQILRSNYVYILLVFIPVGILAGALGWNPVAVFILNLLAIVPLAVLLSVVTEELSRNVRQSVGALLNATFGNAVELIVSRCEFLRSTGSFSGVADHFLISSNLGLHGCSDQRRNPHRPG